MARCRLHDLRDVDLAGDAVVVKSRRRGSRLAISLGNLYLHLQKCDVEILATDEWIRWEKAVHSASMLRDFGQLTEFHAVNSHCFTRRRVIGSSLRDILKGGRYSDDLKFSAVGWAVGSLCQLHRRRADWGCGLIQSVSHGDATVNNVIVNFESQKATWIDFDIRHLPILRELDRRADDLRALIFSAAVCVQRSRLPRMVESAMGAIDDRCLLNRFRERLTDEWGQLNTFQLAQAPLSWSTRNLLTNLLLMTAVDR